MLYILIACDFSNMTDHLSSIEMQTYQTEDCHNTNGLTVCVLNKLRGGKKQRNASLPLLLSQCFALTPIFAQAKPLKATSKKKN